MMLLFLPGRRLLFGHQLGHSLLQLVDLLGESSYFHVFGSSICLMHLPALLGVLVLVTVLCLQLLLLLLLLVDSGLLLLLFLNGVLHRGVRHATSDQGQYPGNLCPRAPQVVPKVSQALFTWQPSCLWAEKK